MLICPKCNAENIDGSKFCRSCGHDMLNVNRTPNKTDVQIKKVVDTSMSVAKKIIIWIVILFAAAMGKLIATAAMTPSQEDNEAQVIKGFNQMAAELNPTLPKMIDTETQLDNVTVGYGARVVYHFSLPKYTFQDIDISIIESSFRQGVVNNICSNQEMKPALKMGAIFEYVYNDKNGKQLIDFEITQNDCGIK